MNCNEPVALTSAERQPQLLQRAINTDERWNGYDQYICVHGSDEDASVPIPGSIGEVDHETTVRLLVRTWLNGRQVSAAGVG